MEHSSDDDTDLSESEVDEYKNRSYVELKCGIHNFQISEEAFTCPFCPNKRKKDFLYKDLLQHTVGVASCISKKRSAKDKANHLALAKYLQNDLAAVGSPTESVAKDDPPVGCDHSEKFAWPWTGIVVNIPTEINKDGRHVGESGSKLRDQLTMRGFNPSRVHPLWNFRGHSGSAVVEFNKDWPGLHNAVSFERAYEVDHHGKKDFQVSNEKASGLYAWVARADDYNATSIIGEYLRKTRDLKSISEIMEEEACKTNRLVSNLTNVIDDKNKYMEEIQGKVMETVSSIANLIEEKDKLHQAYNDEIKKIQLSARDHYQKMFNDHEKLKLQIESQKKELELRAEELEKREAQNESEKKKVFEEIEKNVLRNCSLQLASLEQKKADVNVFKLAEDQKREKERLLHRIIQLETQLDRKQALELEIEGLNGTLKVMKHMEDEGDVEVMKKMEGILEVLREKKEDLECLESLNQTLIVKERKSNDELQDARKELINALEEIPTCGGIGVRRMGEIDNRPFLQAAKRKYPEDEAESRAGELCSLWEEYLRESCWHPFKLIKIEGEENQKEVVNEEDERLKELKNELGDAVFKAVATALTEINEYNPSGRYIIKELWNHSDGRKANLKEGVQSIIKSWKTIKRPRTD